jgi:hypothetical protein
VQIVQPQHQRFLAREPFEQLSHGPVRRLGAAPGVGEADCAADAFGDEVGVVLGVHELPNHAERIARVELAHDLCQGRKRAAFAVRETAADEHAASVAEAGDERTSEMGLPDASRAEHGHERRSSLALHRLVDAPQRLQLPGTAHHCVREPSSPSRAWQNRQQSPPGLGSFDFDRLRLHGVPQKVMSRPRQVNLAYLRRPSEPCGNARRAAGGR